MSVYILLRYKLKNNFITVLVTEYQIHKYAKYKDTLKNILKVTYDDFKLTN